MRLGGKREIMLSVCVMNQKVEKHRFFVWSPYVLESPGRGGSVEVV